VDENVQGECITESPNETTGLRVLFLSSDTGGGHRASAESLARQFELLYPGSTYDLLDIMSKDGVPPYNVSVNLPLA
jgi:1,2-diacylglycerol 3-beta-galactosyltransferase